MHHGRAKESLLELPQTPHNEWNCPFFRTGPVQHWQPHLDSEELPGGGAGDRNHQPEHHRDSAKR